MTNKKPSLLRIYAFSTTISVGLIIFAGLELGLSALFLVIALAALEVSLSFDNAVVNARILKRMSEAWQKVFLTIGILIAVFGVRIILPILLVSIAIDSSFSDVLDLALNNSEEYGHKLEEAHPMIASFGGIFLLMIFLDFFFDKRKIKWIPWLETKLERVGKVKGISTIIALIAIAAASQVVPAEDTRTVITAGLSGLIIYLTIHTLDRLLRRSNIEQNFANGANMTFRAGLLGFIYLEVIDASFSLDGVIGAFAITNQILLIAIGLGIGALYVRTITIHMLRRGVLDTYRYLEHGAHYAIGILAVIMLISLEFKIPEVITGSAGLIIIVLAVVQSRKATKRDQIAA